MRPGVSAPSRVVRSTIAMARSMAASFDARLIERVASFAARASAPTASTPESPARMERSCASVSMAGSVLAGGTTTARSSGATGRRAAMLTSARYQRPSRHYRGSSTRGSSPAARRCARLGALASRSLTIGWPASGHATPTSGSKGSTPSSNADW